MSLNNPSISPFQQPAVLLPLFYSDFLPPGEAFSCCCQLAKSINSAIPQEIRQRQRKLFPLSLTSWSNLPSSARNDFHRVSLFSSSDWAIFPTVQSPPLNFLEFPQNSSFDLAETIKDGKFLEILHLFLLHPGKMEEFLHLLGGENFPSLKEFQLFFPVDYQQANGGQEIIEFFKKAIEILHHPHSSSSMDDEEEKREFHSFPSLEDFVIISDTKFHWPIDMIELLIQFIVMRSRGKYRLKSIELVRMEFPPRFGEILSSSYQGHCFLHRLSLTETFVPLDELSPLILSGLSVLNLSFINNTDWLTSGFGKFSSSLKFPHCSLKEFSIESSPMENLSAIGALLEGLRENHSIEKFSWEYLKIYHSLNDKAFYRFCAENRTIRTLRISGHLGDGGDWLKALLKENSSLTELSIYNSGARLPGDYQTEEISQFGQRLKKLNLNGAHAGHEGFLSAAQAVLCAGSPLISLDLSEVKFPNNQSQQNFFREIKNSAAPLEEIRLSNCALTGESGLIIADWLKDSRTIRFLDLSQNPLLSSCGSSLADSLIFHPSINVFLANNCGFSPSSSMAFARALKKNFSLVRLELAQNQQLMVNNKTIKEWSSAIKENSSLRKLAFHLVGLSAAGLAELVESWRTSPASGLRFASVFETFPSGEMNSVHAMISAASASGSNVWRFQNSPYRHEDLEDLFWAVRK